MHHDARAQRAASRLPDWFSYLIIIAATLTSSSTLLRQPLEGVSRGGGFSLDVWPINSGENRTRASRVRRRSRASASRDADGRCELFVSRKQFYK